MAYYNSFEELEKAIESAGQTWSEADREQARNDLAYGNSMYTLKSNWQDAWNRGDKKAAADIHDQAEGFRKQYGGFSGGADGAGFIKDNTYFRYENPYQGSLDKLADQLMGQQSFENPYQDSLDDLADQLLNYQKFENPYQAQIDTALQTYLDRQPFSYNAEQDPLWQQYQQTYLREGQRAREDTLGNMAAAMGGQTSTAAIHAASQAQDYYNAKLADQLPVLQQQAFAQWQAAGNDSLNRLNVLQSLGSDALNQWGTNLNHLYGQMDALRGLGNDARNDWAGNVNLLNNQLTGMQQLSDAAYQQAYNQYLADYGVGRDERNDAFQEAQWEYGVQQDQAEQAYRAERDALNDARYETEWAYGVEQNRKQEAREQALQWLQMGLLPNENVLAAAGLDGTDAANYLKAVQAAKQVSAGSSSRSAGNITAKKSENQEKESNHTEQDWDALFLNAMNSGHPKSYLSNNYKKYGFTSSSGLLDDYENWAAEAEPNLAVWAANAKGIADMHDYEETGGHNDSVAGMIAEMVSEGAASNEIKAMIEDAYQYGMIDQRKYEELKNQYL